MRSMLRRIQFSTRCKKIPHQTQSCVPASMTSRGTGFSWRWPTLPGSSNTLSQSADPGQRPPPRINLGYGGGCLGWSINIYVCRKKRAAENTESDEAKIADLEQEYLTNPTHETAFSLLDARPWKTNTLVGPEQWISYQAMLTASMLEEEELNDFATFMYCRLNQPNTDHPKGLFD